MDVAEGGNMAILAGAGPMGLGAVDYAIHRDRKPKLLVVTDIDRARLDRAASIYTVADAKANGVELVYLDTSDKGSTEELMGLSGGRGYDDVFVLAYVAPVVEQGDRILARDGCLNFFAGPTDPSFSARFNFYNAHYASTHVVGTSGGNVDDMRESLALIADGRIDPAGMVTHVGGLNAVAHATLNLPEIRGGKMLMYTHIEMPLTAIADFASLGESDAMLARLGEICAANKGLWCAEAERYLLSAAPSI